MHLFNWIKKVFIRNKKTILGILFTLILFLVGIAVDNIDKKPDLEIDNKLIQEPINFDSGIYHFSIKNFGKLPAEGIRVFFDLNYFEGQLDTETEIVPNQTKQFDFESGLNMSPHFASHAKRIKSGEESALATITIMYTWKQIIIPHVLSFNKDSKEERHASITNNGIYFYQ